MSVDPNEAFASDVNELNPPHDFARFKGRPRRAVEILYGRVDVDYETPSDRLCERLRLLRDFTSLHPCKGVQYRECITTSSCSAPGRVVVAAIRAAQLGLSTAIIRLKYWGGVCNNVGCSRVVAAER